MVLLKRMLDNGFNGYHSPTIPRAPRSIRRKGFCQKVTKDNGICAFDLLATVAGKLLEESECSSASSSAAVGFDQRDVVKKEPLDLVEKRLGGEHDEQGSSEGSVFFSGLHCKRKLETANDHVSAFASSSCSVKVDSESVKVAGNSPKCGDSYDIDVEKVVNKKLDINGGKSGDISKSIAPSNSGEDTELRLWQNSNTDGSFLKLGNDVKVGCKDDDEILSNFSQPNSTIKACKSTHNRDRKVNKFLTSKYWNTAPKLKDYENTNTDGAVKPINYSKRSCYDQNISQRNTPFKKRKLFDRSSVVTYDGGISCESVSNSPEKSNENDKNASGGKLREGNGTSTSAFEHQKSDLRDSQVCLSIKSFEVPELFIEVPENTTVGSLKKTVLETVTSILGGGLRVGVLVHGKKIRDDKTLLQTGISKTDDMGGIGFMLEPDSPNQPSKPICAENNPISLPCDSPKTVNRSQINLNEDTLLSDMPEKLSLTDSNSPAGSSGELASPAIELMDKTGSESKALVTVPQVSMEALAVVPVNQRPNKRTDIGQRRTRRPFSVSEVEALVHAVEKLGTGRWRDVKLCAFENAEHRTYVDLKDKWKTLVHTARISAQQRRGEPVPQDLLDRVLAAQAYWSEHQAKQHGKQLQNTIIPKLTDS